MPKIIKRISISDAPMLRIEVVAEEETTNIESINPHLIPVDLAAIQAQADSMLLAAQEAAATCTAETQMQAQVIMTQAQAQGFQQGHQEGYAQGKQEAIAEMKSSMEQAARKAQQTILLAQQQAQEIIIGAERQIIDIAMTITRKILVREVDENPMVVLPIVTAALDKVRDQEQIKIRIHPEDYDLVLQARRDLQILVGHEQALQIVSDQTVSQGGCIIETAYGSVDARIDTQLDTIRKALEEVLP